MYVLRVAQCEDKGSLIDALFYMYVLCVAQCEDNAACWDHDKKDFRDVSV